MDKHGLALAFVLAAAVAVLSGCGGSAAGAAFPAAAAGTTESAAGSRTASAALRRTPLDAGAPVPACAGPTPPRTARCYVLVGAPQLTAQIGLPPSGFYGPAQLQSAYGLPSLTKGAGQTVAIVDAYDDPNAEADLSTYRSNFGLSACTTANGCFTKLNQTGQTSPLPSGDQNWGFEISLDTQMVSAICPNCHIVLLEANSSGFGDLETAIDTAVALHIPIVSTSWGTGEYAGETGDDVHFDHPGVAITNSSGDGAYAAGTQYPAASPYVTAVGGTTLVPARNARTWSETVWSNLPSQGSGSGCSLYEPKPAWQLDTGCTNRTIADVSAVADSVAGYDSYTSQPGWYSFYGTSVASPIIASTYALAGNARRVTFGAQPYAHSGALYDIRKGSTGTCSPLYLCTAEMGYDGPTGNGTPHGTGAF
jgi:subtilase family serine protease